MTGDEAIEMEKASDFGKLLVFAATAYDAVLQKYGEKYVEELYDMNNSDWIHKKYGAPGVAERDSRLRMDRRFSMDDLHAGGIKFMEKMERRLREKKHHQRILAVAMKRRVTRRHKKNKLAKQARKRNRR